MRITGGKYRRKVIKARDERTLRPTSSRIREVIFNILEHGRFLKNDDFISDGGNLVEGRRVVDLFCGTGSLGIEAISRNAEHLTLIDQNRETLSLARYNIKYINELDKSVFIRSDSTLLPKANKPCMLAFIDPPYGKNLAVPAMNSLRNSGWLDNGAVIVLECDKRDDIITPQCFNLLDSRVLDKTKIIVFQYTGNKSTT